MWSRAAWNRWAAGRSSHPRLPTQKGLLLLCWSRFFVSGVPRACALEGGVVGSGGPLLRPAQRPCSSDLALPQQIITFGKVVRPIMGISFAPDQSSELTLSNSGEGGSSTSRSSIGAGGSGSSSSSGRGGSSEGGGHGSSKSTSVAAELLRRAVHTLCLTPSSPLQPSPTPAPFSHTTLPQ